MRGPTGVKVGDWWREREAEGPGRGRGPVSTSAGPALHFVSPGGQVRATGLPDRCAGHGRPAAASRGEPATPAAPPSPKPALEGRDGAARCARPPVDCPAAALERSTPRHRLGSRPGRSHCDGPSHCGPDARCPGRSAAPPGANGRRWRSLITGAPAERDAVTPLSVQRIPTRGVRKTLQLEPGQPLRPEARRSTHESRR